MPDTFKVKYEQIHTPSCTMVVLLWLFCRAHSYVMHARVEVKRHFGSGGGGVTLWLEVVHSVGGGGCEGVP